jgi:three-Cys-motif partner protein
VTAMKGKGGPWTERKLAALRKYLVAFNTALKAKPIPDRPFNRIYIDGFAGSGNRELPELPLLDDGELASFAKGSARIALECEPAFSRFIFVEKDPKHVAELKVLRAEFSQRNVDVVQADANQELVKILKGLDWRNTRGVLFLDPYACQMEWSVLKDAAKTKALDVWILFPVSAINRMLARGGVQQKGWSEKLDRLFGSHDWQQEFYQVSSETDLFSGPGDSTAKIANYDLIDAHYRKRLMTIFEGGVCVKPLRLLNNQGAPLFSLFFACSNPKAATVAMRIANHVLKG